MAEALVTAPESHVKVRLQWCKDTVRVHRLRVVLALASVEQVGQMESLPTLKYSFLRFAGNVCQLLLRAVIQGPREVFVIPPFSTYRVPLPAYFRLK